MNVLYHDVEKECNKSSFHSICVNNNLPTSYTTRLRWALLQRGVCFQEGKILSWNTSKTSPNIQLAESIHALVHEYKSAKNSSDISGFTDQGLVDELRRRGYTVSCTKQIVQEINL